MDFLFLLTFAYALRERMFLIQNDSSYYIPRTRKSLLPTFPKHRHNKYFSSRVLNSSPSLSTQTKFNEMILDYQIRYKILKNQFDDNKELKKFKAFLKELEVIFRLLYRLKTGENYCYTKTHQLMEDVKEVLTASETLFENGKQRKPIKIARIGLVQALKTLKIDLLDMALCEERSGKRVRKYTSECPICYETDNLIYTPCGHGFKPEMLYKALLSNSSCPYCRKRLLPDVSPEDGLDID